MFAHSIVVLLSSLSVVVTVADGVPSFDFASSCRAAVAQMSARLESCIKDEQDARDQLGKQWTQFPVADRMRCTQSSSTGGSPSYVELLTCLEIAKEAARLRQN